MTDARFEAFLDEWEIRKLVNRYAQAVDRNDRETWASLFTKDAVLKVAALPPRHYAEIVEIPEGQLKRYQKTWHGVLTQNTTVHGDTADGEVYCLACHMYTDYHNTRGRDPFDLSHDMLIRYQDKYRKTNGVWQFAVRDLIIKSRAVSQVTLFTGSVPIA